MSRCGIVMAILKMATGRNCLMSGINSGHQRYCDGHFKNGDHGRHNTAKIQHCPISSKFDLWVDNDVPN
jgi:hypothetical protein